MSNSEWSCGAYELWRNLELYPQPCCGLLAAMGEAVIYTGNLELQT